MNLSCGDANCGELLEKMRRGQLSVTETIAALDLFGERGFTEALPDVVPLLHSPESEVRRYALSTLVRDCKLSEYKDEAERMLRTDPDELVRLAAVFALAALGRSFRDHSILRALYQALVNEAEEETIRVEAYNEIRRLLGLPKADERLSRLSDIQEWGSIENLRDLLASCGE